MENQKPRLSAFGSLCSLCLSDGLAMTGPQFYNLVGGVVCKNCRVAVCDCPRSLGEEKKSEGKKIRVDVIARPEEFDKIADK